MPYDITLPNGEVVEVDDSLEPEKAAGLIKQQKPELFKTDLFSAEGIKGLFGTMGESVDRTLLQAKQGAHQELLDAMQSDLGRYEPGTPEYQAQEKKILAQQQVAHDYAAGAGHLQQSIQQQVPNPSIPLEAAMGVAPSLVNMAPAVITRNPLPLAQQGLGQFHDQSYSEARARDASPEAAGAYANIAGPMEAITEWMPIGGLFNSLGKEATGKLLAKTLGREIASEEVNTLVEHLAEQAHVTPDRPLDQFLSEYWHKASVTALQAGMQTGVMAPVLHMANSPDNINYTSRPLPPLQEVDPSAPPPTPRQKVEASPLTDAEEEFDANRELIAQIDASLDSMGLGEPVADVATEAPDPVTLAVNPQVVGLSVLRALGGFPVVGSRFADQPLQALDTSQGPVVMQVGEDTQVRPSHYMKGVMEDIYRLAQEFNPEGIYVILPEDTQPVGSKNHAAGGHFYQNGIHYIIPRQEGSHKTKEGENEYSTYAKAQAWSSMSHEFGHSLISSFFTNGLSKEEATLFELGAASGKVDETVIARLNPKAAQAVKAWEELRERIMTKQISGKEAAMLWLSPTKLMSKSGMEQSYGKGMGVFTPEALARKGMLDYQLNFHEFAAEQMAKMLYARGEMKVSKTLAAVFKNYDPEGLMTWVDERVAAFLEPLVEMMRELYGKVNARELQTEGVDAIPEMKEWFALLAENARQKGLDKTAKDVKVKPRAKTEETVDEKIDWNTPTRRNILKATLRELWRSGQVVRNSKQHRELSSMLNWGDYDGFIDAVEPMLTEKLRFDITEHEAADVKGWAPAWVAGHGTFHIWKSNDVDLNKVNTGEKTIWQGWGFYLGEAKKTFRHYANYKPDGYDYTWKKDGQNYEEAEVNAIVADAIGFESEIIDIDSVTDEEYFDLQNSPSAKTETIIEWLVREPSNATMNSLKNLFGNDYIKTIARVAREVKKFKKTRGDQQVRHFEVLRPLEDFLMFDYDLWQQSPQVQEALAQMPEEYQWNQDVILEGLMDSSYPYGVTVTLKPDGSQIVYEYIPGTQEKYSVGDSIVGGNNEGDKIVELIQDSNPVYDMVLTEKGNYISAWHTTLKSKVVIPSDQDVIKYLHKQYTPYYMAKIDFNGDLQRPGETYYWWLVKQLAMRDKAPYHSDILRRDVKRAKEASMMLYHVGIAGNAYLNNGARGKRIVPPGMNEGDWNMVAFSGKDVRFIKTDNERIERVVKDENGVERKESIIRGLPLSTDKLGQAKARKEWLQLGTKSPTFQAWMEGSVAKTAEGEPLPLFFNTSVTTTLDKREFFTGYKHPNAPIWMNGAGTQMRGNTRIVPGYMAIKNPLEVEVDSPHVPTALLLDSVRKARSGGYDGVVFSGPDRRDDVYVAVDKEFAAVDPDFKHVGNAASTGIKFDLASEEGSEAASKWQQLKNFGADKLADGLYKLYNAQWIGLQLQQLAHMNPQWLWFKEYDEDLRKYYRKAAGMQAPADTVLKQVEWMGKENQVKMGKFTRAEAKGGEHWTDMTVDEHLRWTHKPNAQTYEKLKEFGIDPDSTAGKHFLSLYIEAKNANQFQMDSLERVMFSLINRKYAAPEMHLQREQKVKELRMTFMVRRKSPFWANDAYGQFHIVAKNAKGEKIYETATDSLRESQRLKTAAEQKYGKDNVTSFEESYEQSLLMRLPVEFIDEASIVLGLDMNNPEDRAKRNALAELMGSLYSKTPDQIYDPNKMLVEGGSTDFQKTFASFSMKNANFIAKMEYRKYLQNSISKAKNEAKEQSLVAEQEKINRAVEFMERTVDYALNPQEELAFIRGTVAVAYLMYNVGVAAFNLFGLVNTWSVLNRELGYIKGTTTFAKTAVAAGRTLGFEAGSSFYSVITRAAQRANNSITDPNWEMVNGQPTEIRRALKQAKDENILDQTYAYYLAGQAMKGQLSRMASVSIPGKAFKGFIDTGMALFRATELFTRRASFLAAYEIQQQVYPDKTEKQRYEEATRVIGLMQGDYTKGNKPVLFRGQLMGFLTIFMTFVQNQTWAVLGGMDKGLKRQDAIEGRVSPKFYRSYSMQMLLMLLFLAGPEGLPFGENIMDIIDIIYKKLYGKSARTAIREFLVEMEADPMLWTRGLAYNFMGFDVSKKIGVGRILPVTDRLGQEYDNAETSLGTMAFSALGVGGSYAKWLWNTAAMTSETLRAGMPLSRVAETMLPKLPGGPGNIMTAAKWTMIDARGPAGGLLAWDDDTDRARSIHPWEIVGKGIGLQPQSVAKGQAMRMDQYENTAYWRHYKQFIYDAWWQATEIAGDRESIADVKVAIAKYKKSIPHPDLDITDKMLRESVARRKKNMELANTMTPIQRMMRGVAEQSKETF